LEESRLQQSLKKKKVIFIPGGRERLRVKTHKGLNEARKAQGGLQKRDDRGGNKSLERPLGEKRRVGGTCPPEKSPPTTKNTGKNGEGGEG